MENNNVKCDFCKEMKDRETEIFPLIFTLPYLDENNKKSVEFKIICNECFCDLANDFKKIMNRSK